MTTAARLLPLFTTALIFLGRPAHAQFDCGLNDNLSPEPGWSWCDDVTGLNLPINCSGGIPGFTQSMLDLCWKDCKLETSRTLMVNWEEPSPSSSCSVLHSKVTIIPLSAASVYWQGDVSMTYSRTWLEYAPSGETFQVWRFLANGDFYPNPKAGSNPNPVPPCSGSLSKPVRFTGYVDWAYNCQQQIWSNSWMMSHGCDGYEHLPGFRRSGSSHPDRSYTFVGPSGGFVPSTTTPAEIGTSDHWGSSVRRIRRTYTPGTVSLGICLKREAAFHLVSATNKSCGCKPTGTGQFAKGRLDIIGSCGSIGSSVSPHNPIQRYHSMSIGEWTDVGVYPGLESLRWSVTGFDWLNPGDPAPRPELFFGVSTNAGYKARSLTITGIGDPLGLCFIDQANSIDKLGNPQCNLPFESSIIINLNHIGFGE